eukprot:1161110-Pelagomonas_calceolata.AAC.6
MFACVSCAALPAVEGLGELPASPEERKGKGYKTVPAIVSSLAEAKTFKKMHIFIDILSPCMPLDDVKAIMIMQALMVARHEGHGQRHRNFTRKYAS